MGDVIDLAAWRREHAGAPDPPGAAVDAGAHHVAPVRAIRASWHPSLGTGTEPAGYDPRRPDPAAIRRLELAIHRIDRVSATTRSRYGGRLARTGLARRFDPRVETELLAVVGQLSLGLVREAADRAERVADELGGVTASRP